MFTPFVCTFPLLYSFHNVSEIFAFSHSCSKADHDVADSALLYDMCYALPSVPRVLLLLMFSKKVEPCTADNVY